MTRYWWDQIGGYDYEMKSWGGENLDQSLRTWLCGGEIVVARESRVAHMWRDASKPKTRLHYSIPTDDVRRNRLRAAQAWLGPWADKVRSFPQFDDFREGGRLELGSLDNILYYRDKLKCKDFHWYMNRFRDIYVGTGRLPESVFHIRDTASGMCLNAFTKAGKIEHFDLIPCNPESELQRFNPANSDHKKAPGGCCSGIKVWDFDACLSVTGESVHSASCEIFGHAPSQHVQLIDGMLRWKNQDKCIVPASGSAVAPPPDAAVRSIIFTDCASPDHVVKEGQRYKKRDAHADGSFQLEEALGGCLGAGGDQKLVTAACSGSSPGTARWMHMPTGELKHVQKNMCVDANDFVSPIIYPCYVPGSNQKQIYVMNQTGWIQMPRTWADNGRLRFPAKCFDSNPVTPRSLTVKPCKKLRGHGSGSSGWEAVWSETPLETKLFQEAEKVGHSV